MHNLVKLTCQSSSRSFSKLRPNIREFNSRVNRRITDVPVNQPYQVKKFPLILKSLAFTVGVSGACFSIATIAQYERISTYGTVVWGRSEKYSNVRTTLNEIWNSLSGVKKVVLGIICINSIVLLCGRSNSTAIRNVLLNNFCLSPTSTSMTQMILSTFNHSGLMHLGFNMLALFSLSQTLQEFVCAENFLAFYLSSGVFASFCSKVFNLLAFRNTLSVGASGAVVSCFALVSFFSPDSKFYIFPLPFAVEAQQLLQLLVGIDLSCLLLGFKTIDHMAHLGGAFYAYLLFGNKYGKEIFKDYKIKTIKSWKKLKNIGK